jgi:hypothetical protein
VAASKLFFRREAKVFANHHAVADTNGSRKRLVVGIANTANDLATITRKGSVRQGESAEVAQTVLGDNVVLFHDLETSIVQSFASVFHQNVVRERLEGLSFWRSDNVQELFSGNVVFSDNDHMFFLVRFVLVL